MVRAPQCGDERQSRRCEGQEREGDAGRPGRRERIKSEKIRVQSESKEGEEENEHHHHGDRHPPVARLLIVQVSRGVHDLPLQGKVDLWDLPFSSVGDLEQFRREESEERGDDIAGENLLGDIEFRGDVVVELSGEADPVFCAREFFLQLPDGLVGFQGRIVFGKGEETAERARERLLFHCRVGDPRCCCRGVSRGNDFLESVLFKFHIAPDRADQIWNEIMPPFQLDIDLLPSVLDLVTERHEAVVLRDDPDCDHRDEEKWNHKHEHGGIPEVVRIERNLLRNEREIKRQFVDIRHVNGYIFLFRAA